MARIIKQLKSDTVN